MIVECYLSCTFHRQHAPAAPSTDQGEHILANYILFVPEDSMVTVLRTNRICVA